MWQKVELIAGDGFGSPKSGSIHSKFESRQIRRENESEFSTEMRDYFRKGDSKADDVISRMKDSKMQTILSVRSKAEVSGKWVVSLPIFIVYFFLEIFYFLAYLRIY